MLLQRSFYSAPAGLEKQSRPTGAAEGTGALPGAGGMKRGAAGRLQPRAGCCLQADLSAVQLRLQISPPATAPRLVIPGTETGPTGLFWIRLDRHGKARLFFTGGSTKHCATAVQKEEKHLFNKAMADLTRNTAVQAFLGRRRLVRLTLLENSFFKNCLG